MHINPDHFLETSTGRVVTPQRNAEAWRQCVAALSDALAAADSTGRLYVLVGAQGAGKSTYAKALMEREPEAVIFDAILVKRSERAPILALARQHHVPAIAIWFQASLVDCLSRNAARASDQVANPQAVRNVFAAIEPPVVEEGFVDIIRTGTREA